MMFLDRVCGTGAGPGFDALPKRLPKKKLQRPRWNSRCVRIPCWVPFGGADPAAAGDFYRCIFAGNSPGSRRCDRYRQDSA
jgi:hypothetical protein